MEKNSNILRKRSTRWFPIFVVVWGIVQLACVIGCYNNEMGPDALGYTRHAIQCYNEGTFYPSINNLHDVYVQAPGLVNFLIPIYAVFGDVRIFLLLNIIMNIAILLETVYLGEKFFNKTVGYIAGVCYAIILANIFAPVVLGSEILYLFLALTGFVISLKAKPIPLISAGILYAVAYTVRPLVLAFLVASIVYYIYVKRKWLRNSLITIACFAIPLIALGEINQQRLGTPIVSSTTGGYNLLMTAYDKATPLPEHSIFYKSDGIGHPYLSSKYTFAERDSIWKSMAVSWIKEHPFRYLVLCGERVFIMWNKDVWSVPNFLPDHLDNPTYAIASGSKTRMIVCQAIRMCYSIVYYVVCVLFLISIVKYRKEILSGKGIMLLILLLGIGGTCLFPMEHRYHYPYMFILCIWVAYYISNRLEKGNK